MWAKIKTYCVIICDVDDDDDDAEDDAKEVKIKFI